MKNIHVLDKTPLPVRLKQTCISRHGRSFTAEQPSPDEFNGIGFCVKWIVGSIDTSGRDLKTTAIPEL